MRTTLNMRGDVHKKVKGYAAARPISKGAAVAEVLERGFNAEVPTNWENGILIFSPGPSGAVTAEHVRTLNQELY